MSSFYTIFAIIIEIDILQVLTQCPLFKGVSENEVIEMMHTVSYRIKQFKKGDIFATVGTPCTHSNVVISGEMAAIVTGPSGRVVRISTYEKGTFLSPSLLFADNNTYLITIEVTEDTRVLRLD